MLCCHSYAVRPVGLCRVTFALGPSAADRLTGRRQLCADRCMLKVHCPSVILHKCLCKLGGESHVYCPGTRRDDRQDSPAAEQIEYLVGVLSPQELAGKFIAGEWSAAQNVHHLVDSHMNSYVRCRLIMPKRSLRSSPTITSAGQRCRMPRMLMCPLRCRYSAACTALGRGSGKRCPKKRGSARASTRSTGPVTLEGILKLYAGHGEAHVEQIRRTVAAQYAEPPTSLEELLGRIDREWGRLNGLIRRMTPEQLEASIDGGWSPKDHLAHVTAWERYLIGTVVGGGPGHEGLWPHGRTGRRLEYRPAERSPGPGERKQELDAGNG